MTAQVKTYYTPEQYLEMDRAAEVRSEYYDGEIFAMAGASLNHVRITQNMSRHLGNLLEGRPCEVGTNDLRVRITEKKYSFPDIVGYCSLPELAAGSNDILLNPELIIEVLSPSTESFDRGLKFAFYQQIATLKEYVLISQDQPRIDQYVRQSDSTWFLSIHTQMDDVIKLESMGVSFSLKTAYARVEFPNQ